jgi:hypothetical protein
MSTTHIEFSIRLYELISNILYIFEWDNLCWLIVLNKFDEL